MGALARPRLDFLQLTDPIYRRLHQYLRLGNSPARRSSPHRTTAMKSRTALTLCFAALAACGGGTDAPTYQQLADQAAQQETLARSLGVDSPCDQDSQCGLLTFLEPVACARPTYQIYSLVSSSALAASAAAGAEVALASRALALLPPPAMPCLPAVLIPPSPVCVAHKCQGSPGSPG